MSFPPASASLRALLVALGCVLAAPAGALRAEMQAPATQEAELIDRLEIYALLQTGLPLLAYGAALWLPLLLFRRFRGLA